MSPAGDLHFYFATATAVLVTVFSVVIAAFLVNRFAPTKRRHIRLEDEDDRAA